MSTGCLIVFSGIDGAGKSTQIERLRVSFRQQGRAASVLWSRGGYTPGMLGLKRLVRRLSGRKAPPPGPSPERTRAFERPGLRRLWLTAALLDLLWFYGLYLRWQMRHGRIVICDRYVWDTLIDFQLNFAQLNVERWALWRWLVAVAPQPQAAFLLLVPVAESVRRSDIKQEPFREPPERLAERLARYQTLAGAGGWRVLEGRRPAADLAAEIRQVVAATCL